MTQLTQTTSKELSKQQIDTLYLAGIIPNGIPQSQIRVFAQVCKELQLSPFSKEIYCVGYTGRDGITKYSIIVGIGGFRKMAKMDANYAGVTEAIYDLQSDGTYKTSSQLIAEKQLPTTATVTCYKFVQGHKVSFTHTAVFKEFSSGKDKWSTMPFQMIAKVAESFAYRKAFAVSGVHIEEELGAIQEEVPEPKKLNDTQMIDVKIAIAKCNERGDFEKLLKENPDWKSNSEIIELMSERNQAIIKNKNKTNEPVTKPVTSTNRKTKANTKD